MFDHINYGCELGGPERHISVKKKFGNSYDISLNAQFQFHDLLFFLFEKKSKGKVISRCVLTNLYLKKVSLTFCYFVNKNVSISV